MSSERDTADGESSPPVLLLDSGLFIGIPDDTVPAEGDADPVDLGDALGPVGWLTAVARQRSQDLARELSAVHEIGRCYRRDGRGEFAANEVGGALGWSATMAAQRLQLAAEVIERLPVLHRLLQSGELDEVKVVTIAEATRAMPDDLACRVTDAVVGSAARVTKSRLITLIESHTAALDSDWMRRRERAARRRVRVVACRTPQGTADVAVRDLSTPDAVAMTARTDALAWLIRSAALARGIRAPIAAVRALVQLRQTDGSCVGLDDDALIDTLTGQVPDWLRAYGLLDDKPPGGGPPDDGGPQDDGPHDGGPHDGGPHDGGPHDGGPHDDTPRDDGPPVAEPDDVPVPDDVDRFGRLRAGLRTGVAELRLRLSTALDLDELPGEVPTWGTVTAPTARDMLRRAHLGDTPSEWRLVLVDDRGHPEHVLLVRPGPPPHRPPEPRPPDHRPPDHRPSGPRRHDPRRGRIPERIRGRMIVELAATTTMLAALDPAQHPRWATLIRRAQRRLAGLADRDAQVGGAHHPATTTADRQRRHPGRELDRWIRVRDRYCIGVLCHRPAYSADVDHTRDWIDDGVTIAANLGGPCRHCHRLKHDGGWRLTQPEPGRFVWHTPLGATYPQPARPIVERLTDPAPRPDGRARPVLDADPPPDNNDSAWTDRHPSGPSLSADVPERRQGSRLLPSTDPATCPVDPPF